MYNIETREGRIYYWKTPGNSQMPTLVFLHGLSSNHVTWDPIIEFFSKEGYPTLALDLRGHGLSDKRRRRKLYTIPEMRRDLEEILEREGISNFCLIGYSYGAHVAMDFASAHPESAQAVALISANHVSPFDYHWFSFMTPLARFGVNLLGWLLIWQKRKNYYYFEPEKAQGYWKSTFSGYATMPLSINFWMLSEVFALNYRHKLERIACPTLIVRGKDDGFITEREVADMAKLIPHSEVATLGLGHFVAAHHQSELAARLLRFLQTLP